jgi:lipopolysaccharide export system protein LptA
MKLILILLVFFFNNNIFSKELGETEITTDGGIEVFQLEKYYLLKKNVIILTDTFELKADLVKAYFEKDMYDIVKIESTGNASLISTNGMKSEGNKINFSAKDQNIEVFGENSFLIYNNIKMFSDNYIQVNNLNGKFKLEGDNSRLQTEDIQIDAELINGKYIKINEINELENLYAEDKIESNIKTKKLNMFAVKAKYNKEENIMELFDDVKIIRNSEIIIGDYAKVNTLTESYRVTSTENKKVKILLKSTNE